jgi:hypothetical protein
MTNEMMRPCTLWGHTFDACDVVEVDGNINTIDGEGIRTILIGLKDGTYFSRRYKEHLYLEAITTIADALNAPIKVTQAVLDAMEKVPSAKFHLIDKAPKKRIELYPLFWNDEDAEWFVIGGYFDIGDYIQADCPLALQVLLGFTIEGVPKDD